jgi:hypothetical protein
MVIFIPKPQTFLIFERLFCQFPLDEKIHPRQIKVMSGHTVTNFQCNSQYLVHNNLASLLKYAFSGNYRFYIIIGSVLPKTRIHYCPQIFVVNSLFLKFCYRNRCHRFQYWISISTTHLASYVCRLLGPITPHPSHYFYGLILYSSIITCSILFSFTSSYLCPLKIHEVEHQQIF